jgi:hypothetical protein
MIIICLPNEKTSLLHHHEPLDRKEIRLYMKEIRQGTENYSYLFPVLLCFYDNLLVKIL